MDVQLIVTIASSAAAIVITLIGATWKLSVFINELSIDLKKDIDAVAKESEAKRARIYERLDEHKRLTDNTFVRKDMAEILQNQLLKNDAEMKDLLKEFMVEMRTRCAENHSIGA